MTEEATELALLVWRHALLTRAQSDAQELAISAILQIHSRDQPALAALIHDQIAQHAQTAMRQPPQEPEELLAEAHYEQTPADYLALLKRAPDHRH